MNNRSHALFPVPQASPAVQCADLAPPARQLLWLVRHFIAARLDYVRVSRHVARTAPRINRAVPVLLCHLLLEIAARSRRRITVSPPCHGCAMPDEIGLLALIDLAQQRDTGRLPYLLRDVCNAEDIHPIMEAALKLGESLLQDGLRIEAASFLPSGALPTVH